MHAFLSCPCRVESKPCHHNQHPTGLELLWRSWRPRQETQTQVFFNQSPQMLQDNAKLASYGHAECDCVHLGAERVECKCPCHVAFHVNEKHTVPNIGSLCVVQSNSISDRKKHASVCCTRICCQSQDHLRHVLRQLEHWGEVNKLPSGLDSRQDVRGFGAVDVHKAPPLAPQSPLCARTPSTRTATSGPTTPLCHVWVPRPSSSRMKSLTTSGQLPDRWPAHDLLHSVRGPHSSTSIEPREPPNSGVCQS